LAAPLTFADKTDAPRFEAEYTRIWYYSRIKPGDSIHLFSPAAVVFRPIISIMDKEFQTAKDAEDAKFCAFCGTCG
ncbi:MAG: hypothetical protein IKO43_03260, partial [Kiritimatiellae bacterium]|nr:hypothetical protein [Kiritimatiellia bacterium]